MTLRIGGMDMERERERGISTKSTIPKEEGNTIHITTTTRDGMEGGINPRPSQIINNDLVPFRVTPNFSGDTEA